MAHRLKAWSGDSALQLQSQIETHQDMWSDEVAPFWISCLEQRRSKLLNERNKQNCVSTRRAASWLWFCKWSRTIVFLFWAETVDTYTETVYSNYHVPLLPPLLLQSCLLYSRGNAGSSVWLRSPTTTWTSIGVIFPQCLPQSWMLA